MLGDDVAESATAFDGERGHGDGEGQVAQVERGLEDDGQGLGVALGFGAVLGKIKDA